MVNNEFHLIGIAISNFQDIGNGKYVSYLLRVEIEKFGSSKSNSFQVEVQVYGTNKAIDTSAEVLGQQVVVNGYVDSFTTKDGNKITKLIAQNVYVLGKQKRTIKAYAHGSVEQAKTEEADDIVITDDDLPF